MSKNNKNQNTTKSVYNYSQHVSINKGQNYCIVSCSKHRLPDLIDTLDEMIIKGWEILPGLTSDDGLVFQALKKFTNSETRSIK